MNQQLLLIEDLTNIRKLIKKGWCKGSLARDKNDDRCRLYASHATNFCLIGALTKTLGLPEETRDRYNCNNDVLMRCHNIMMEFLIATESTSLMTLYEDEVTISDWNDSPHRTKQQVLDMLTRAINHAKAS